MTGGRIGMGATITIIKRPLVTKAFLCVPTCMLLQQKERKSKLANNKYNQSFIDCNYIRTFRRHIIIKCSHFKFID
jgi:hypothetical protein